MRQIKMEQKCEICWKLGILTEEEICDFCLNEEIKFWSEMKR